MYANVKNSPRSLEIARQAASFLKTFKTLIFNTKQSLILEIKTSLVVSCSEQREHVSQFPFNQKLIRTHAVGEFKRPFQPRNIQEIKTDGFFLVISNDIS